MTAKNTSKNKAPRKTSKNKAPRDGAPAALTLKTDGATDALKGRLMCRTSVIHEVLVEAHNANELLSTKTITERVNARWARALEGRPTNNAATASHLSTMKGRDLIEHGADGRGWRLTKGAVELLAGAK